MKLKLEIDVPFSKSSTVTRLRLIQAIAEALAITARVREGQYSIYIGPDIVGTLSIS